MTAHPCCVSYLLEKGADANAPNATNDTPMLAAASKNHPACVKALLAAGARHLIVNKGGDTPLSLAVRVPRARAASCPRGELTGARGGGRSPSRARRW